MKELKSRVLERNLKKKFDKRHELCKKIGYTQEDRSYLRLIYLAMLDVGAGCKDSDCLGATSALIFLEIDKTKQFLLGFPCREDKSIQKQHCFCCVDRARNMYREKHRTTHTTILYS